MLLLQRKGDYPPLEAHQHEAQKMSKTGEKTEVLFMPKTESPDLELPHLQKKVWLYKKKLALVLSVKAIFWERKPLALVIWYELNTVKSRWSVQKYKKFVIMQKLTENR